MNDYYVRSDCGFYLAHGVSHEQPWILQENTNGAAIFNSAVTGRIAMKDAAIWDFLGMGFSLETVSHEQAVAA